MPRTAVTLDAQRHSTSTDKAESAKPALVCMLGGGSVTELSLADIKPRMGTPTRKLDCQHVLALAESMEVLGLLEPLVVDRTGRLIAGAHRLAALHIMMQPTVEDRLVAWNKLCQHQRSCNAGKAPEGLLKRVRELRGMPVDTVPVRVVDVPENEQQALAMEVAENEQRRDYTAKEIQELAERLAAGGFRAEVGRPKSGERALGPILAAVIGKNIRTVQRMLNGPVEEKASNEESEDAVDAAGKRLVRAINRYLEETKGVERVEEVRKRLEEVVRGVEGGVAAMVPIDPAFHACRECGRAKP